MNFLSKLNASPKLCSTSNGTRFLAAQFSTKGKLDLRICTGILQVALILRTTAQSELTLFTNLLIQILILGGFRSCLELVFGRPITMKRAIWGKHCLRQATIHSFLSFC